VWVDSGARCGHAAMESKVFSSVVSLVREGSRGEDADKRFWNLLCCFAFLSQFQPSEPFLVDFLVGAKGLSNVEVYNSVFNLFVYARLPFVALVGLVSEVPFATSRGMLVVGAMCSVATVLLTRFGDGLESQQVAQFTVAFSFASRMAVPALIFTMTPPAQCQERVHTVKAVMLLSNCLSAALGELLRDEAGMPLASLFDVSTIAPFLGLICTMLLPVAPSDSEPAAPRTIGGPDSADTVCYDSETGPLSLLSFSCGSDVPPWLQHLQEPLIDLWSLVRLRGVMWWTMWALVMNPVHGLILIYWQSLVRTKHFTGDHNGSMMAGTYFIASILTLISGRLKPLSACPSVAVIGSTFVSGLLLCRVVAESHQVPLFMWLLTYLCIFEVTTAMGTFQVGHEVRQATTSSTENKSFARAPRCARLTLLFSTTVTLAGIAEVTIQVIIRGFKSVAFRIAGLGISLTVLAMVLMLARSCEVVAAYRRRRGRGIGARSNSVMGNSYMSCTLGSWLQPLLKPTCLQQIKESSGTAERV